MKDIDYYMDLPEWSSSSDKSKVMVSLKNENNGKNNVTSMVVEHSDLTNALTELYEMHWNKAIPLSEFIISHKIKK